jgi:hypothetical protein
MCHGKAWSGTPSRLGAETAKNDRAARREIWRHFLRARRVSAYLRIPEEPFFRYRYPWCPPVCRIAES